MSNDWVVGNPSGPGDTVLPTAKELYKQLDQMTDAYSDNAEALQMVTLGIIATTLISCLQEMEDISETLRHTYYDSKR